MKMRNYLRRQEANLIEGIISKQEANQIYHTTYNYNTRCDKRDASPPLIHPCRQPGLKHKMTVHALSEKMRKPNLALKHPSNRNYRKSRSKEKLALNIERSKSIFTTHSS